MIRKIQESKMSKKLLNLSSIFFYLSLIAVYYVFPIPDALREACFYPLGKNYNYLPVGVFIIAFQSIRNFNLIFNNTSHVKNLCFLSG